MLVIGAAAEGEKLTEMLSFHFLEEQRGSDFLGEKKRLTLASSLQLLLFNHYIKLIGAGKILTISVILPLLPERADNAHQSQSPSTMASHNQKTSRSAWSVLGPRFVRLQALT